MTTKQKQVFGAMLVEMRDSGFKNTRELERRFWKAVRDLNTPISKDLSNLSNELEQVWTVQGDYTYGQ